LGREFETTVSRGDLEAAAAESEETEEAALSPSDDIHQSGIPSFIIVAKARPCGKEYLGVASTAVGSGRSQP